MNDFEFNSNEFNTTIVLPTYPTGGGGVIAPLDLYAAPLTLSITTSEDN